jgi:hypothetical protein
MAVRALQRGLKFRIHPKRQAKGRSVPDLSKLEGNSVVWSLLQDVLLEIIFGAEREFTLDNPMVIN